VVGRSGAALRRFEIHFKIHLTLRAASPYDAFCVVRQARQAFLHGETVMPVGAPSAGGALQGSFSGWRTELK